jgi:hypothetical protein
VPRNRQPCDIYETVLSLELFQNLTVGAARLSRIAPPKRPLPPSPVERIPAKPQRAPRSRHPEMRREHKGRSCFSRYPCGRPAAGCRPRRRAPRFLIAAMSSSSVGCWLLCFGDQRAACAGNKSNCLSAISSSLTFLTTAGGSLAAERAAARPSSSAQPRWAG